MCFSKKDNNGSTKEKFVRLPSDLFTISGFQKYVSNNKTLESSLKKEFDKIKKQRR